VNISRNICHNIKVLVTVYEFLITDLKIRQMSFSYIYTITIFLIILSSEVQAQVTIGNGGEPDGNALLDLKDKNSTTKGLLLPRLRLSRIEEYIPLSKHVEGMLIYNKTQSSTINKGVYINSGIHWQNVTLPQESASGKYLILDNNLNPVWDIRNMPSLPQGVYSLIDLYISNTGNGTDIPTNNSNWFQIGKEITFIPQRVKNRIIINLQILVTKDINVTGSGWVQYEAGIFVNDSLVSSRMGKLVFQNSNNEYTFHLMTLHFSIENLSSGNQKMKVKFRRLNSQNYSYPIYVGKYPSNNQDGPNNFNTLSSISYRYYEDKTSPFF
jgi:hypothetical protein